MVFCVFGSLCRRKSNRIKGQPFHVVSATPVDMFPHTPHCELVMLLERVNEARALRGRREGVKEEVPERPGTGVEGVKEEEEQMVMGQIKQVEEELGTNVERVKEEAGHLAEKEKTQS